MEQPNNKNSCLIKKKYIYSMGNSLKKPIFSTTIVQNTIQEREVLVLKNETWESCDRIHDF